MSGRALRRVAYLATAVVAGLLVGCVGRTPPPAPPATPYATLDAVGAIRVDGPLMAKTTTTSRDGGRWTFTVRARPGDGVAGTYIDGTGLADVDLGVTPTTYGHHQVGDRVRLVCNPGQLCEDLP